MSDARSDDEPTDVLAAEEFVVPAPDPALQPEVLQLPADLVGGVHCQRDGHTGEDDRVI